MKKILVFAICLSFFSAMMGQNDYDAFLFSQTDYVGTARYMGAGRAFGAVGGDFSALISNPAAIGLYKKSEVSFTPMSLSILQNGATYYGSHRDSKKMKYAVPQVGLVLSSTINRENSNWRYWHFGFGYNRLKDFNNSYGVEGIANSSFSDPLLDAANNSASLGLDAQLAYDTWVLNPKPDNNGYYSSFHNQDISQTATVRNSGAMDEIAINFGGNYNDQLFIGAGLGIPVLDITQHTTINESLASGAPADSVLDYTVVTKQRNTGAGINFRLGLIYQPVSFFRFGVSFQTPSFFWKIKDSFYRSFSSNWIDSKDDKFSEYNNLYHFSLTTPLKANVSAAFIINKRAFVSAEYELTDYSLAKLSADDYSFNTENDNIVSKYGLSHSFRIGGEVSLSQMLYLRAGYNFKTSSYKLVDDKKLGSAHYGSLGFGIRAKRVFFDMAYVLGYSKDDVWLYNSYYVDPARVSSTYHRVLATIGFKF